MSYTMDNGVTIYHPGDVCPICKKGKLKYEGTDKYSDKIGSELDDAYLECPVCGNEFEDE